MDSRDSSPRSRDPDTDHHPSFEDPPVAAAAVLKVKLMCSYGGRIQPRPHDNHLTYVAGDTKILTVDRHIKFPALIAKLSSLANNTFFKYQLPGEDLDALISVTNDDDLHHMMLVYDRLCRTSPRPARLRLFLFPLPLPNNTTINFAPSESKPDRQWFVDALNSVQVPPPQGSSPPPTSQPLPANPDFLFGLDKPAVPDAPPKDAAAESECSLEDRPAVRELEPEIQELRRLQIGNNEQLLQRKIEEDNDRVYGVDSFIQKNTDNVTPLMAHAHAQVVHPGTIPGTVSFLQERNNAGYSFAVPTTGNEVYLIQTSSGIFQAVRPMTGPVGQPVYLFHAPGSIGYGGSEAGRGGARW